jgi:hypothetical protein
MLTPMLLLLLLLPLTAATAAASPATLWEAISTNSSFSVLAHCVRVTDDPALLVGAYVRPYSILIQ